MLRSQLFSPRSELSTVLALSLALLGGLLGATRAAAADASLDQAIRGSGFIFLGTIEKPGASNLSQLAGSSQTALVRVSEVIEQPEAFRDLRDDLVTVVLADTSSAVEGEQAVFFATGYLYGENLAVSEVTRLSGRFDVDSIRKLVAEVRQAEADEALSGRLASASAVITGVVAGVRPMRSPEEDMGEHAASWVLATLDVDTALKGEPVKALYFAQDTDNFWRKTPKLAPGEKGIFLLQPYEGRDLPRGSSVVIDVLDVQPMTELDHVRGLLR
jgi:hypothetical protein